MVIRKGQMDLKVVIFEMKKKKEGGWSINGLNTAWKQQKKKDYPVHKKKRKKYIQIEAQRSERQNQVV